MSSDFIDLREVQKETALCYAHRKETAEQKETLIEHTMLCQKYYGKIVQNKQLQTIFKKFEELYFPGMSQEGICFFEKMRDNVISFHDIGKINPRFQEKNMKNCILKGKERPHNNVGSKHSILSAVLYLNYFFNEVSKIENLKERKILRDFIYIHSFLIARHHGVLSNFQIYLDSFAETEGNALGWYAQQWVKKWIEEDGRQKTKKVYLKKEQKKQMLERLTGDDGSRQIYLFGYTRLLFSLLVAVDYYSTSEYMNDIQLEKFGQLNDISNIIEAYEKTKIQLSIRSYEKTKYPQKKETLTKRKKSEVINDLRSEMFLCQAANYPSRRLQISCKLNSAVSPYCLYQRAVFYGTFLSALLTRSISSPIVLSYRLMSIKKEKEQPLPQFVLSLKPASQVCAGSCPNK